MSIYLEFPSIEDYPIYSAHTGEQSDNGLIPASPFNWLLTLEFSALRFTALDSPDDGLDQSNLSGVIGS